MSAARITHIGGPTVLIEVEGWRLLTDPTFDPPGGHYRFGWGTSSDKLAGPSVARRSSAASTRSCSATTTTTTTSTPRVGPCCRRPASWWPPASGARRLGGNALGLEPWATTTLAGDGRPAIEITATPCRHGPPLSHPIVGDVIGFALRWEGQQHGSLWVSGDTVLYDGVREVAQRVDVGVALLHLGGVRFPITGPVRYTMTADEAIELCRLIEPRTAIPIHYEGWKHFREGREAIERELAAAPGDVRARFRWLPIGEPTEVAV